VVAGTGGDSGKTLVALGLLLAWREAGLAPAAFKKGPDYIDAAWLSWAAGSPCRNLDTYLQPRQQVLRSFLRHAAERINLVEGNRGLYDGLDVLGTHSTATLARLLSAPVVLVVPAVKVTRTVAAVVLGCKALDPQVEIAGVVLNRVAGARHEALVRRAVEESAGVPVVGALPRMRQNPLPDRHLGLVTPEEHAGPSGVAGPLRRHVEQHLDLARLLEIARGAGPLEGGADDAQPKAAAPPDVRVGYFCDSAFTFYYPDNLEALQAAGAELVQVDSMRDAALPDGLDALYLGGGFPETHAARLADNAALMAAVRDAAEAGLPIYAECGGLIYLCRSLICGGQRYPMAGVLPLDLELFDRPRGHGYVELLVDGENPFFERGTLLRGHEFHYTTVADPDPDVATAFVVRRGSGSFEKRHEKRDGIVYKNVLAGYTHLHAVGTPGWASEMVRNAARFRADVGRGGDNGRARTS
jgi:cobyrinic acid a,c-diamide synthase